MIRGKLLCLFILFQLTIPVSNASTQPSSVIFSFENNNLLVTSTAKQQEYKWSDEVTFNFTLELINHTSYFERISSMQFSFNLTDNKNETYYIDKIDIVSPSTVVPLISFEYSYLLDSSYFSRGLNERYQISFRYHVQGNSYEYISNWEEPGKYFLSLEGLSTRSILDPDFQWFSNFIVMIFFVYIYRK